MTEQQNDENKPQDTESDLATDSWGDVLENELANDNADETELIEDAPGEETDVRNEQSDQDDSSSPSDESGDASNLDSPLDEQAESGEYDLSNFSVDESELIEDTPEEETELLNEQSDQDDSSSPSDESGDASNLDLPLDEQAESSEYDLSDLYDTKNEPAQTSDLQNETKSEELPDFDLPVDESDKTEENEPAKTEENEMTEAEEDELAETMENEMEYIFDRQDATEESIEPEIANNPPDEALTHDIPPVTATATPMASDNMQEHQQTRENDSSLLAIGIGLTGILVAAAAIWLNMGLSDQLAQLEAQQQPQNDDAVSQLEQEKQELAKDVEKLTALQNQQAETQLSGLESMQQQLDALTAVVATRVAKQWQTSNQALPATEKPVTTADEATTAAAISSPDMAEDTRKPDDSPDVTLEQLVVSASVGNIRSTASSSGVILSKAKRGTIVSKVSQTDDWIQIRLENGTFAWGHQSIFKSPASTSGTASPEPTESAAKIPAQSASGSNKGWAVNLMSLGSEAAAEKQVAHFQGMGIKAEYALIPVKGKAWYRVRIAGFANEKDAIAYKELLSNKHSISAWHNRM